MLISIETNITCDFPGGGGFRPPIPPSGSAHVGSAHVTFGQSIGITVKSCLFEGIGNRDFIWKYHAIGP